MKKKVEHEEAPWESPSLDWIHRVRRELQAERKGMPVRPLPHDKAEMLVKRFGLKVVRPAPTEH